MHVWCVRMKCRERRRQKQPGQKQPALNVVYHRYLLPIQLLISLSLPLTLTLVDELLVSFLFKLVAIDHLLLKI